MKSVADLKRAVKAGVKLKTYNHLKGCDKGIREVIEVDSTGFIFEKDLDAGRMGRRCLWPLRAYVEFEGTDTFKIYRKTYDQNFKVNGRELVLTYNIVS